MIADEASPACFGCGTHNPHGLKLHFEEMEGGVCAEVLLGPRWQSWPGRVHGGVVASVLDEALAWAVQLATGKRVVTTTLKIRYVAPVQVDTPYQVRARLSGGPSGLGMSNRVLRGEGEIVTHGGQLIVAGDASFMALEMEANDGE